MKTRYGAIFHRKDKSTLLKWKKKQNAIAKYQMTKKSMADRPDTALGDKQNRSAYIIDIGIPDDQN